MKAKCEELDRAIYLIEGSLNSQDSLQPIALRTAMAFTQVVNGMIVLVVDSLDQTIELLRTMHRRLSKNFARFLDIARTADREERYSRLKEYYDSESFPLPTSGIFSYREFQDKGRKLQEISVEQIFGHQLRQVKGLSAGKCETILSVYPTPLR